MGQIVTGLTKEVNVNGDLPPPVPNDSSNVKSVQMTRTSAGATDELVPVGKIWYIVGWSLSVDNSLSNTGVLEFNGSNYIKMVANGSSTYKPFQQETVMFPFPACPILAAGDNVTFTTLSSGAFNCFVYYIEVDE